MEDKVASWSAGPGEEARGSRSLLGPARLFLPLLRGCSGVEGWEALSVERVSSTRSTSESEAGEAGWPGLIARDEALDALPLRLVGVSPGVARAAMARPRMFGFIDRHPRVDMIEQDEGPVLDHMRSQLAHPARPQKMSRFSAESLF